MEYLRFITFEVSRLLYFDGGQLISEKGMEEKKNRHTLPSGSNRH